MADDNPDKILPESPDFPDRQRESAGSMTPGAAPNANEDGVSPINGDSYTTSAPPPAAADPNAKAVHEVVNSDIGVSTLLNRLKQSVASAKEFATFLKKRSTLEEEHSNGLRKLCKITAENIRKPEHRHGSFLQSYEEVTNIHERMSDNGAQFATSLLQMHEDLLELTLNIERGRKHWKTTGLNAEQRVADAEAAMRKSKVKYDSLAEDYDRAKTGDRHPSKKFGLKGPKSAQQHEDDLLRKLRASDEDYASKVQAAQSQRAELLAKTRPETVKALEDLIKECDSALTLQMQKFASFNEKLLLSNGLNVSPLKGIEAGHQPRSLREAVHAIDNEQDLSNYISSFASKIPARISEIKYEKNPVCPPEIHGLRLFIDLEIQVLNPPSQPVAPPAQRQPDTSAPYGSRPPGPPQPSNTNQSHQTVMSQPFNHQSTATDKQHERSSSQGYSMQQYGAVPPAGPARGPGPGASYGSGSFNASGPPQLSNLPFHSSQPPMPQGNHAPAEAAPAPYPPPPPVLSVVNLPPLKPVFGLSLEQLFERDGSAVPMVVYQCIQAVDLFGLEVEGIYRLSGTSSHVSKIKAMFDNDASKVDFRDPANFFHDVNSVAGLLKQFFRELPDPLLTAEHYASFIEAAKSDDDTVRRDSLHAIINSLPDPNYATLRALTLHLNRVQDSSPVNRMNASNLAIVFGPTLMGANTGPNIQDAGWQVRVIDTILQNTYQIFDDD
ncbi:GTPase activation, GAP [Diplocarpon rosae]|nr:GTPase activation, GAP [Diplocarpon rosae]